MDWTSTIALSSSLGRFSTTKTNNSHSGSFALRLETIDVFDDTIGIITNGNFGNDSIIGGQPFTTVFDTLVAYYSYTPNGFDTAAIGLTFSKNGNEVGRYFEPLYSANSYTKVEIPFVLSMVPDTLRIDIISSFNGGNIGSTLFIDGLILKSIITSLEAEISEINDFSVFPNPSNGFLNINFELSTGEARVKVIDAIGKEFINQKVQTGRQKLSFNLSDLQTGTYYIRIETSSVCQPSSLDKTLIHLHFAFFI